jgi:peroxiredoxin
MMNLAMHSHRRFSFVALLLLILLAGCGGSGKSGGADSFGLIDWPATSAVKSGAEIGNRSPNFRLQTPAGTAVELSAYAGKPTLINFFASWCANCKEEMKDLDTAYQGGVQIVGIDYRESGDVVTNLATETGATFPMLLDPKTEVSRNGFKVTNLPVTVLIDGDGVIREIVRGPVDAARIQELIASVSAAPEATS